MSNDECKLSHHIGSGFAAGLLGTLLGYPLDVIKTRMSIQSCGLREAVRDIYAREGYRSFYRGVTAPLASLIVLNSLAFTGYEHFCKEMQLARQDRPLNPLVLVAGMKVGVLTSWISTPFELVKIQSQISVRPSPPADCGCVFLREYVPRTRTDKASGRGR
jgi:solute carrier family 25 carnitine/acylcarnitine transporter 20/29